MGGWEVTPARLSLVREGKKAIALGAVGLQERRARERSSMNPVSPKKFAGRNRAQCRQSGEVVVLRGYFG